MTLPIVIARGSSIEIFCERNISLINLLARIPSSCRVFDINRGSWLIREPHVANALVAVRKTFGDYEALVPLGTPAPPPPAPAPHVCPTPITSDHRLYVCLTRLRVAFPGHAYFGILPDAPAAVKSALFRRLMARVHPEGSAPDDARVREVTQAWEQVKQERVSPRS